MWPEVAVQSVVLDTDVASLIHKGKLAGPVAARLIGRRPLITFVTLRELTKWVEIGHWGARSRQALSDWLSGIPVLPGDESVAAMWGRLSVAAMHRGRPRAANDMWIAAPDRGREDGGMAVAQPPRGTDVVISLWGVAVEGRGRAGLRATQPVRSARR
jgi:hypothetical protein